MSNNIMPVPEGESMLSVEVKDGSSNNINTPNSSVNLSDTSITPNGSPKKKLTSIEIAERARAIKEKKSRNIFISYDKAPLARPENVAKLKKLLKQQDCKIFEHDGRPFINNMHEIDERVVQELKNVSVVIFCVSREFRHNWSCKHISDYVKEMNEENPITAPEVLYCFMQGDYTTQSQFKVDGWLGHMVKDCTWYPCWEGVQVSGGAAAIMSIIALKRRSIAGGEPEDIWEQRCNKYKETHQLAFTPQLKSPVLHNRKKKVQSPVEKIRLDPKKAFI